MLLLLCLFRLGYGQDFEVIREAQTVIEERHIYLNGGMRSEFGGKSRTYIKFDLPPNTLYWYYSFTTTEGENGGGNLNLAIQLGASLVDPSGIVSTAASSIEVPQGVATADIYLIDQENLSSFINKQQFNHYTEGLVQNTKQTVVRVDDIRSGTWFLGIMNPSTMSGIHLNIEIVAITETSKEIAKSDVQQKAELYGGLGWTQYENGDYEKCIEYCDKASIEFELGWVQANKALALLMLGEEDEAMETYINSITLVKKQPYPEYVFQEMLKDINNAKKMKPDLSGADEIKQLILLQGY